MLSSHLNLLYLCKALKGYMKDSCGSGLSGDMNWIHHHQHRYWKTWHLSCRRDFYCLPLPWIWKKNYEPNWSFKWWYLTGGEVGRSFRSNLKIFTFLYLIRVFLGGIQLRKIWTIPLTTSTTYLHLISDEDELDVAYRKNQQWWWGRVHGSVA